MGQIRRQKRQPLTPIELRGVVAFVEERHPQSQAELLQLTGMQTNRLDEALVYLRVQRDDYPMVGFSVVNGWWSTDRLEADLSPTEIRSVDVSEVDAVGVGGPEFDAERFQAFIEERIREEFERQRGAILAGVQQDTRDAENRAMWWLTIARRDGECRQCGETAIRDGGTYVYQFTSKRAYCVPCADELNLPYRASSRLKELV